MNKAKLFVLSAPSGAGKTTLKDLLLEKVENLHYSISVTTRLPRAGEIDGQHYFFRTKEQFQEMLQQNELVEHMEVHGNFYGTPKFFIEQCLRDGKNLILDLDVYGKVNFDKGYPNAIGVMISPPSLEVMETRLRKRGTDSEETIALRLKNAKDELDFATNHGKYEYNLINDDLQRSLNSLKDIVINHITSP